MPRHGLPVVRFSIFNYRTVLKFTLAFNLDGCNNEEADSLILLEREKAVYKHLGVYKGILIYLNISSIGTRNFLMANNLLLVLCDFSNALVRQEMRYRKVDSVEPFCISVTTKIFAISSLIYKIMTKKRPYNEIKDKDKIKGLFRAQIFPLTVYIPLRNGFKTVAEVLKDI
ncbi:hypothetical protein V2W45_1473472 [Cenococcum geophilum]